MTEPAGRAVVSDDGETIRLTLYGDEGVGASMTLAPVRAIALAGELIAAALLRLSNNSKDGLKDGLDQTLLAKSLYFCGLRRLVRRMAFRLTRRCGT
jgi:hypothetical protein